MNPSPPSRTFLTALCLLCLPSAQADALPHAPAPLSDTARLTAETAAHETTFATATLAEPFSNTEAHDAPDDCPAFTAPGTQTTVNVRIDNDLLGGHGQDQGYSNGLLITAVSPNLIDRRHDPCVPGFAQHLDRHLSRVHPDGFDQVNIVASFAHGLFTPTNREATELILDDRPYAATLLFSLGYNARKGDWLHSLHLRLGWLGPSALGKETQDTVHKVLGVEQFQGWGNQLHDEPVFMLQYERLHRYELPGINSRIQQDLITHWSSALGNLNTYFSAGVEWRIGWKLPDDFGSSPQNPAGENTAPPMRNIENRGLAGHLFVVAVGSWTLHDITLDGNTFKNSHRVKRNPLGAELGLGISSTYKGWKFALARYYRTREFEGQKDSPFFGSFTISRQF